MILAFGLTNTEWVVIVALILGVLAVEILYYIEKRLYAISLGVQAILEVLISLRDRHQP